MKRRKIQQRRVKTTSLETELKTLNTQDKAGFFELLGEAEAHTARLI